MPMRPTRDRTKIAAIANAVVLLVCATLGAATVVGATPQLPAAYYGQALIDGEPAPEGIEITAKINGSVRGTITTDANGTFGGAGMFEKKLDVNGSADDEGETVTFLVGNQTADTTIEWSAGDHQQLTIAATSTTCINDAVSGSDNTISLSEIQEAINWWAEETEVPSTGEETIRLSKIQSLINAWAEGTTVSCGG